MTFEEWWEDYCRDLGQTPKNIRVDIDAVKAAFEAGHIEGYDAGLERAYKTL